MNKFLKALIISLIIFAIHETIFIMYFYLKYKSYGYYGSLGGIVFALIFGFWGYYILTLAYLFVTTNIIQVKRKFILAIIISLAGYLLARVSDIIDGDFILKFDFLSFVVFALTSLLLMFLDYLFAQPLRSNVDQK